VSFHLRPWGCADARRQLDAYVDGKLSSRSRARLEAHLYECPGCSAERFALSRTLHLLREAHPPSTAPAGFDVRLRERLDALPPRAGARWWPWALTAIPTAGALLAAALLLGRPGPLKQPEASHAAAASGIVAQCLRDHRQFLAARDADQIGAAHASLEEFAGWANAPTDTL
jgi:anti-sigma factor RsiW